MVINIGDLCYVEYARFPGVVHTRLALAPVSGRHVDDCNAGSGSLS